MKPKAAALKYDASKNAALILTAKGEGKTAQKIIEIAKAHDIPIKEDADLVEMLSKIELENEIPPNMYKAIAEVFRFIYKRTQ
ncbi:MAG: EscU/YscU/HrcU family type III secretion system export apparatus switch protein [Epsilonproteobacteria bacterium]|nr:EscU/YscU/HrcU family type III secretion system export apparatus switch protein [Campylobacterota bacterium]